LFSEILALAATMNDDLINKQSAISAPVCAPLGVGIPDPVCRMFGFGVWGLGFVDQADAVDCTAGSTAAARVVEAMSIHGTCQARQDVAGAFLAGGG
jgi:hypothetical protein